MGQEGDDRLALPVAPPPNPAARRRAMDAAMRKFDGLEPLVQPRRRFSIAGWASTHRAAAGGLVTAALVAVVAIPAIQVAIRDRPAEVTSEDSLSSRVPIIVRDVEEGVANEPPPATQDQAASASAAAAPQQPVTSDAAAKPSAIAEERSAFVDSGRERMAKVAAPAPPVAALATAPAPAIAAPAPPPPPPAPPPPSRDKAEAQEMAADSRDLVVTGSRVRQPELARQRGAPRTERGAASSPAAVIDPFVGYVLRLQTAFRAGDRRSILRLAGYPLRVSFGGEVRSYRTARDVERDYDRIFTPAVRAAALGLDPGDLDSRDGGRLRGDGPLWFGCGARTCSSADGIRLREVRP